MIALKQLLDTQPFTSANDIEIIEAFFTLNDMEEEGMDLIHKLTKSKIEKLNHKQHMVKDWVSQLPSKYLYQNYDLKTADALHKLELDYLSNGGELSNARLEWARENVPNIKKPEVYFLPLVNWLEERGIKFQDR